MHRGEAVAARRYRCLIDFLDVCDDCGGVDRGPLLYLFAPGIWDRCYTCVLSRELQCRVCVCVTVCV